MQQTRYFHLRGILSFLRDLLFRILNKCDLRNK